MKRKKPVVSGQSAARRKWLRIHLLAGLLVVVLLFIASLAPKVLFSMQDRRLFSTPKSISAEPGALDPQAAELYLVKAVHHLYEQGYKDHYSFLFNSQEFYDTMRANLIRELHRLGDEQIISREQLARVLGTMEDIKPFLATDRKTAGGNYIEREMISIPYEDGAMWVQMEPKTGKLLSVALQGQLVSLDEALTRQSMEAYVRYLGLDVLDDWTYLKPYYVSQKAQLQITAFNDTSIEIVPLNFLKAE